MIHRSGSSASSLLPTSAATARTCATSALSSVSGMVKNCGACGSMAPPITVDIMANLLCRKAIAHAELQQAWRHGSHALVRFTAAGDAVSLAVNMERNNHDRRAGGD